MNRKERRKMERNEKKQLKKSNPEEYRQKYNSQPVELLRTREERQEQVEELYKKLLEVGFYPSLSGIKKFKINSLDYIQNGTRIEEELLFDELPGVKLQVLLSPKKSVDCAITVKNWNGYK